MYYGPRLLACLRGIASTLFLGFASLQGVAAKADEQTAHTVILWRDLAVGMPPEQVLSAISKLDGIKSVKLRGRTDAADRVQIRYTSQKILIASIPFELKPQFQGNKLKEVWLTAPDQCSAKAVGLFQGLAAGLATKYPKRLGELQTLRNLEVSRANARALESGKPQPTAFAFTNDSVAAALIFQFEVAAQPPYPHDGGKLGESLWRLAQTMYEQRRAECEGTGDRRMGVAIRYMQVSDLEGMVRQEVDKQAAQRSEIADKL